MLMHIGAIFIDIYVNIYKDPHVYISPQNSGKTKIKMVKYVHTFIKKLLHFRNKPIH